MKKYFIIYAIIAAIWLNGCNADVKTENYPGMFVAPAELNEDERKILDLAGDGKTEIFNYSVNENIKSLKFKVTDYSDTDNPKVVDLFSFNKESEDLKGRLAVSFNSENEIKVSVEAGDSVISGSHKSVESIEDKSTGTSFSYLQEPYEIVIGEPVPVAAILKTSSNVRPSYFAEDYIKNPELFKQYDSSYLFTVTFYDKPLSELPE